MGRNIARTTRKPDPEIITAEYYLFSCVFYILAVYFSYILIIQLIKCIKQCRQSVFLDSCASQMQLTNPNNASRPTNFGSTERSRVTESTMQALTTENGFTPSAPLLSAQNSPQIHQNYAFQASNTPQINREFSTFSVPESLPPTYSQAAHSRSLTPPPSYSALFNWMND